MTCRGHPLLDAHRTNAPAQSLDGNHRRIATPEADVPASTNGGHRTFDAQRTPASVSWSYVKLCADSLDDFERTRIAAENRVRSLIQVKGLEGTPEEKRAGLLVELAAEGEKLATKELERAMKQHPLGEWIKQTIGVGLKQGARLLAEIGDPLCYVDGESGEIIPRTVSKLWAYCGYRPGQKRRKGEQANWNAAAKMRANRVAESCMKQRCKPCTAQAKENKTDGWEPPSSDCTCSAQGFVYRAEYDAQREKWAERETSDGHKHNHALRVVAKEVLKDIWRFSRGETTARSMPRPATSRHSLNGAKAVAAPVNVPPR